MSLLSDFDLQLSGEGTPLTGSTRSSGPTSLDLDGVVRDARSPSGPRTPRAVSVIGDFNGWNPRVNPLHARGGIRGLGGLRPGDRAGDALQVRDRRPRRRLAVRQGRPLRLRRRAARPGPPRRSGTSPATTGATREWMADRGARQSLTAPITIYEVHLGSWMRVPEEGNRWLTYREIAPKLADYAARDGLHPRRADARRRAPVRRLLGLPGRRLLRPDEPVRHAARLHVPDRHAAPRGASA